MRKKRVVYPLCPKCKSTLKKSDIGKAWGYYFYCPNVRGNKCDYRLAMSVVPTIGEMEIRNGDWYN